MASSSSSFAPLVPITFPSVSYDVFISFRGKDTRDNFTSHLYAALCRQNIKTFIDSKGLRSGDEISPTLLKIIKGSKLSVIVFSENYASSRWCLEELAKIILCKRTTGQLVIPVFYRVDPAVVRYQKGSFKEAFDKHEGREQADKVQMWRASLIDASNVSGWDSRVTRPESKLTDKIVEDVLNKLAHTSSTCFHGLVGIDFRIQKVESLLRLDSKDVCSVGIWGMGGIGKTTIAKAVFDHLYQQFEGFYFLEDIKEELKRCGKVALVNKFLSSVLDGKDMHMGNLSLALTQERLRRKRILVVFDNVDDQMLIPLQDLVKHHDLFGPGSKVLFTSRDIHVLKKFRVDKIYEVDALDQDKALQLFVMHAFNNVYPTNDFLELSERVVTYTKGHPLAIKVLSSTLLNRSKEDWMSILNNLEKFPKPSIMNILRMSYEELSDDEKNIFLDIVFFFIREERNNAIKVLESCYDFAQLSFTRLVENALIIIRNDRIEIHDLLQEMSFRIVREECHKDLGKRSRLLDPDDVYNVLTKKKGTDTIKGICLDLSKSRNMQLDANAFASMTRLRFLKFYSSTPCDQVKLQLSSDGLGFFSDELRLFHWEGFPSKSLPSEFCWEQIVEIKMPRSKVKQLWTGAPHLANLRKLDLSRCEDLIETPDFSNAKNIETIFLSLCTSLVTLHPSVQYLNKLQSLSLVSCTKLRNLPRRLDSTCLKHIALFGCTNVEKFSDISGDCLERLLLYEGCTVRDVPPLHNLKHLQGLSISKCLDMTKFPDISESIVILDLSGAAIEEIPSSIQYLTLLSMLDLSDNKYLSTLPTTICKLKSLERLELRNCPKLEEFPEILEPMDHLQMLDLSGCVNLKKLPRDISNLTSLQNLCLRNCKLIRFVPKLPRSVQYLNVDDCELLEILLSRDICHSSILEFMHCCRLDEKTREKIMTVTPSRVKVNVSFSRCLPENEIPEWFSYRSLGSSVPVPVLVPLPLPLPLPPVPVPPVLVLVPLPLPLPLPSVTVFGITVLFVYESTYSAQSRWINVPFTSINPNGNALPIYNGEFRCNFHEYATRSDHAMLELRTSNEYDTDHIPIEDVLTECSALSYELYFERGEGLLVKEWAVHLHLAVDSGSSDEEYYSSSDDEKEYYSCTDDEEEYYSGNDLQDSWDS